jgi:hypothetical protein
MGKTTVEMQDANNFLSAGWDFVDEVLNGTCDYWQIAPGDYPKLCYCGSNRPVMPEGLGTAEQPYLIQDARDLGTVWFEPLAHYRLVQSVDLSGIIWSMAVIPWFEGNFDGCSHVISNLCIQGTDYVGFFGRLDGRASVSKLGLEDVEVNGTGSYVGGLVGYSGNASIISSYSRGMVCANEYVGGLLGWNGGTIGNSYSSGIVSGKEYVGGLIGRNSGGITASYSTSTVTGDYSVGGLIGINWGCVVTRCYSAGPVTGSSCVGGLAGYGLREVFGCFWDIQTSGQATSVGGTGKTTAEMQTAATFLEAGWDFLDETANGTEDIWWILEGLDYPRFWWEGQ